MSSHSSKVGEIFSAAGAAFSKLGELTMQLHPDSTVGTKWTEEELEVLESCLRQFGEDLTKISERICHRSKSQIRTQLRKKVYEDAGMPIQNQIKAGGAGSSGTTGINTGPVPSTNLGMKTTGRAKAQPSIGNAMTNLKSSEVTLNMLNASDGDAEMSSRLDFDPNAVGTL